jgi:hypothetical protein
MQNHLKNTSSLIFAWCENGERRQMGERVKGQAVVTRREDAFDEEAAVKSLALVAKMLGLECSMQ